jgi:hypothetical protein
MDGILARLFVLLLLFAEWAGDPHFGRCLYSGPMSSQPVCCHSIGLARTPFSTACSHNTTLNPLASEGVLLLAWTAPVLDEHAWASLVEPRLAYLFMSIQC